MSLAPWLLALAAPLAVRVLAALGLGIVTYTGVDAILTNLIAAITGALGGIPVAAGQIAGLLGIYDAIGIGLGALTTRVSLQAMTRLVKL